MSEGGEAETGRWEIEKIGSLVEVRFQGERGKNWFMVFDRPEFMNFMRGCMSAAGLAGLAGHGYAVVPTWAANSGRNEPPKDEQGFGDEREEEK